MTRRAGRINKYNKAITVTVNTNFFNVHIITRSIALYPNFLSAS